MPINQDTHYVIKNGIVEQPAVVKDGLELYYDAKGKHNNDVHKDTLLDLSGNNRHGTLVNFAYEGVSGYQENGTGGILLDDVDDKIVRPAIPNIQYTSASRNMWMIDESWKLNKWSSGTAGGTDAEIVDNTVMYTRTKLKVTPSTQYVLSSKYTTDIAMIVEFNSDNIVTASTPWVNTSHVFTTNANTTFLGIQMARAARTVLSLSDKASFNIQLEKAAVATAYTPYIPLPIMTYQMNGNILSFEKDGTVKRTTKDANGNEVVVSRKGINLVRNGNFANETAYWTKSNSLNIMSSLDGVLTTTSVGVSNEPFIFQEVANNYYKTGDRLYVKMRFKNVGDNLTALRMRITNVDWIAQLNSDVVTNPVKGQEYTIESIVDLTTVTSETKKMKVLIVPTYYNALTSTGQSIEIYEVQVINLTEAYRGNSLPDLAYIQSHPEEFAWTPNPNDLIETIEIKNNLVGDLENLQGNDFEQHEDGIVTYTNEAEEGSVVRVDIDGISDQQLRFRNATGEQVVITEHDQVDADAIKKIEFQGNSVQLADKYREVIGTSVTIAPELHDKNVADKLVVGGNTTQYTESSNVVTDGLEMWLSGRNFSNSPATTVWKDLTGVNNGSASGFAYTVASGSDGNGGIVFDGVDDGIIGLPSQTVYDYSSFTLEVKCIIDSTSVATSIILGNRYREGIITSFLKLTPNMFEYYVDSVQHGIVNTVNRNTLVHLTIVKDKNTLKYFTNGVLTSSKTLPAGLTMPPMPFGIGKDPFNTSTPEPFKGTINFVRKYGRALSDAEVLQNYNAGLSIPIPNIAMPQEVRHVNSGNKVMVHGKNLFNPAPVKNRTEQGVQITNTNGVITLNGTSTGIIDMYYTLSTESNYYQDSVNLRNITNRYIGNLTVSNNLGLTNYINIGSGYTTNTYVGSGMQAIFLRIGSGTVFNNQELKIQIEEGATATSYEPFKGYQETTIPVTLKSIG